MITQKSRLLAKFDCTREYPADCYFTNGDTKVVETTAGRYREAEAKPSARFGYRFTIEHIGQPHLVLIRYPDDKRRYMCIMDGTCYDLTTGVFTGWVQPLTGRMQEIHLIFWPRWQDCSIVFMTWGEGEPAAVSNFEIHELDSLPALEVPGDTCNGSRREFGIQYEDPSGTGASEGALSHQEWVERVITYARHTGQNLFVYPIVWYHGPQYPSTREPSDAFNVIVARDRKQYVRWTTAPNDWVADTLEEFGKAGLKFQGALTLLRLGSLMQKMNINLDSIKAGADTINNMLWNNNVQAGTNDWTWLYNARNYPELLSVPGGVDITNLRREDFTWAYGEKTGQPYPYGPIFNPLHPVVQEAILGLVKEIVARYSRYPAFKGISFNLWHATILYFGSIHSGYDDYTVSLFQRETGINVPVDIKAPDRFAKRYEFLTYLCRPVWINWRCRKIRELIRRIRDIALASRPDLRVTITLWHEPTAPVMLDYFGAPRQIHARPSNFELYRDGGFDISLYQDEPGIEIDLQINPARDRDGDGRGENTPLDRATMFRDHDFLDQETNGMMRVLPRPGVFIFNCWVESWGSHWRWLSVEPDDINAKDLAVINGKPAEGVFRTNCEFPPDGFWWESQWRIIPAMPGGEHFMEHYAHALAEFDACRITRGGICLEKAHSEPIQRFARAYRALPAVKFVTVGNSTDPIAVRTLVHDGRRYIYLVNREYYPIRVELTLDCKPEETIDLATGQTVSASQIWPLILGPYELQSFTIADEVNIREVTITPPIEIVVALTTEAKEALQKMDDVRATGTFIAGMDVMSNGIKLALKEGRLAWLRRALTSYIVHKCQNLSGSYQKR